MIVGPELLREVVQQGLMVRDEGSQLLVVTSFVDPAERLLSGNVAKLGCAIGEQGGDDGQFGLVSVTRYSPTSSSAQFGEGIAHRKALRDSGCGPAEGIQLSLT